MGRDKMTRHRAIIQEEAHICHMDKGKSVKREVHRQEGHTEITVFNNVMPCSLEEKYLKIEATSVLFYQTRLHIPKEYIIILTVSGNRSISHPVGAVVKRPGNKDDHSATLER